jgi:hypothetical protein
LTPDNHPVPDDQGNPAAARVEAVLERLGHVDLGLVVVAPPDVSRLEARARARSAAVAAGRSALLDEAVTTARDATLRIFARSAFSGTWAATEMAASVTNANDRVAAAAALEEAVTAAAVEDLVDPDTVETLRATWEELTRSTGLPTPGSLAGFASAPVPSDRGPFEQVLIGLVVVVTMVVAFAFGGVLAVLVLALGMAGVTAIARRRRGGTGAASTDRP